MYRLGLHPNSFLKALAKLLGVSNPHFKATSIIFLSSNKSIVDKESLLFLTYSIKGIPFKKEKTLQK